MSKFADVLGTTPSNGESIQKHFAEIYRQIGTHFINNADRLGDNVVEGTSGIDIFISLEPNSTVSIDISQKEILVKQSLSAAATIGKLQVDSKFNRIMQPNVEQVIDSLKNKIEKSMEELTNE
ncbi:hypothetical protein ACTHOQ_14005 [Solibacillus silvestris]|uniref:hypothetical protein n=1 Tax=Solibacillus silvestris TaxID=76853 RepID=UPI003F7E3219